MIKRKTYLTEEEYNNSKYNVVLYGGGTQSTGLILLALTKLETRPDFAVFADTGAEPDHVIDYKNYFADYVKKEFDFDIYTVQKGNLEQDTKDYIEGNTKRVASLPLFSKGGMIMRQCTYEYKIVPIQKFIKDKLGIKRKNKEQSKIVSQWFGISLDEIQRMKQSPDWWSSFVYPLIEQGMVREDTINLVKKHGLKEPPRSACYFCPFHSPSY